MKIIEKTNPVILGIMFCSVVWTIGSFIRWFIIYPDTSNMVFGITTGVLIFLVCYIINWTIQKEKQDKDRDKAIDLTRDYMRQIEDKLDKITNIKEIGEMVKEQEKEKNESMD